MSKKEALITTSHEKGQHFLNVLVSPVYNNAKLDKDQAQRLNENGGEFQDGLRELIVKYSRTNQFAGEEVKSDYGYFSGYKPKSIGEQIKILREFFPNIGNANEEIAKQQLPLNAEGWFVIPRWQNIAPTYGEAVQKVLDLINKARGGRFYNYRVGQLGSKHLRQHGKTEKAFQTLGEQQKGYNLLVFPAQFGKLHRGRSVRWAREVMNAFEFGLGAFEVGCMILTHPERLQHYNDLWIDCAGDEYSSNADGDFSHAPSLHFNGSQFQFDASRVGYAYGYYGSSSAFLPQ